MSVTLEVDFADLVVFKNMLLNQQEELLSVLLVTPAELELAEFKLAGVCRILFIVNNAMDCPPADGIKWGPHKSNVRPDFEPRPF